MRHWSQLAIRNWRVKPGRALATTIAIALGVGTVVWVTCSYESVTRSIGDRIVNRWIGHSHLAVESPMGHWGSISERTIDVTASQEGITAVAPRLKRRMNLLIDPWMNPPAHEDFITDQRSVTVDVVGIDPLTEYDFRSFEVEGRLIEPEERGVAILEGKTARLLGIKLGDMFTIEFFNFGPSKAFELIGTYEARRIAKFQKPTIYVNLRELQELTDDEGRLTAVDAMHVDPTPENLESTANALRLKFAEMGLGCQVSSSTARLNQLEEARRQSELALLLVAAVALLTAFFIIMTTLSMGMTERITQLGMLRCVGMTRSQLAGMVVLEVAPLGVIGLALGIPIGLGLTHIGTFVAPEYIQDVALSGRGVVFALIGGALTTLGSALIPAIQAARISPLEASRPQARPPRRILPAIAALLGVAMVGTWMWMIDHVPAIEWVQPRIAVTGTALLYLGYGLMTPFAVQLGGTVLVPFAARLLGVKPKLLNDQVGRAAWRGAGICCGLMVGLSLLISVVVQSESVRAGWDFPKRLAEAFVWTREPVPGWYVDFARSTPGVAECTVVNEVLCDVGEQKKGFFDALKLKSTFVAGEPERFLKMAKLVFLEGDFNDAYEKCCGGGYILVPTEASRAFNLHLGDKVPITASGRTAVFEVAGVVQSPALDIAVNYFQADSYMMVAAAGSVLGTLEDAKKHFGVDEATLLLMNFALPEGPPPDVFSIERPDEVTDRFMAEALIDSGGRLSNDPEKAELLMPQLQEWLADDTEPFNLGLLDPFRGAMAYVVERWNDLAPAERWELYFDQLVLRQVARNMDRPRAIFGSLRQLKQQIDKDVREATILLAAIPVVALLVAAIGVGNLMTANVNSRKRELAVIRSAGATRGQIMRLVLGEAIVLGGIGAAAGLAVGLHSAGGVNHLTLKAIGFAPKFQIPWSDVGIGIALTVGVCLLAGLTPARRAARDNVIDALRAT